MICRGRSDQPNGISDAGASLCDPNPVSLFDSLPGVNHNNKESGEQACKPDSVPRANGVAIIPLGAELLPGSSDLPESSAGRAAPPLLFGLAPRGVYPASRIAPAAVRSYRTFSPLPGQNNVPSRRYIFCGTFRETRFERVPPAVSRHAALWRPDFPP